MLKLEKNIKYLSLTYNCFEIIMFISALKLFIY